MSNGSKDYTHNPGDPERPDPYLESLFDYIDAKHGYLINRLRDFVEFQTVSSDPSKRVELLRMSDYVVGRLKTFGFKSTVIDMNEKQDIDSKEGPIPLILAETDSDPTKRTVLFYCHYDVYSVNYHECWEDPFELRMTIDESEIHGKGASEGKGPLLCVINAIGAYQKKKIPLPVNIKIILDPLGTLDEDTTGKFLKQIDTDFFFNVDFVSLCTGRWLGKARPCITHGSRGICHFTVEVEGPSKDLHSGTYGGLFNEPMADLMYILNGLVDKNGVIRITDIYEDVPPVKKEEIVYFKTIDFSVRDYQQDIGATQLQVNEDKASILMRLWRQPSLSIHGVQGAFSEPGVRHVIPGKVIGKFSINLVPNMSPSKVKKKVVDYLGKVWKARKSSNKIRLQMTIGKLFWYTEPSDINVVAAKNAVAKVYSAEPDLIREPRRVRIANVLRKITGASVVMIPIGKSSDISDEDSEKIDMVNYVNGAKVIIAYLKYLATSYPVLPQQNFQCDCKITGQLEFCKCYLKYINIDEEAAYSVSQEWSEGRQLPGITADERPAFKYYYLSLLARQKILDLQKVVSTSHLFPVGSCGAPQITQGSKDENEQSVSHMSFLEKRGILASFSVPNLRDESKPRKGMWITKSAQKIMKQSDKSFDLVSTSSPLSSAPESTKVIPLPNIHSEPSIVPVQPTEFSFRLAQGLRKNGAERFSRGKVLRPIQKPTIGPNESKLVSSKSAPAKIDTNSAELTELTADSFIAHPNVLHGVNAQTIVSSTSQILYKKRLKKKISISMISVKSADPSFRVEPTNLPEQSLSFFQTPSLKSVDPIHPTSGETTDLNKAAESTKNVLKASEASAEAGSNLSASSNPRLSATITAGQTSALQTDQSSAQQT